MNLLYRSGLLCFGLSFMLLAGCASVNEKHYFKTQNGENYFRVKIDANAGFSRAKYISGFYDESAVDLVFNELKSLPAATRVAIPREGEEADVNPVAATLANANTLPLDPDKSGVFVMILSTDANSVANTIGNYAQNKQLLESIAVLSNKDKLQEAEQTRAEFESLEKRGLQFVQTLKTILPTDKEAKDSPEIFQQKMLTIVKAISSELGVTTPVNSFDDAALAISNQRK